MFKDLREHQSLMAARDSYNEHNDCTVITFALVFNTTYEKAHKHIKYQCGRTNRRGVPIRRDLAASLKNTDFRIWSYDKKSSPTLKKFVESYPEGRYYVCVRGHALAVIDGVIHDWKYGPRRKVQWVMRVYL